MVAKKTLSQDAKGRFLKNIGWVRNPRSGKISQRKFYLGHDEDAAWHVAARLSALWKCVELRFERKHSLRQIEELMPEGFGPKVEYEMVGNVLQVKPYMARPLWCPTSLLIAEAIRNDQPVARIPFEIDPAAGKRLSGRYAFDPHGMNVAADQLNELRRDFNVIHIEFEDDKLAEIANQDMQRVAHRLQKESVQLLAKPLSHQALHQAIGAYKVFCLREHVDADGESTESAKTKVRQIEFVRRNTENLDLTQVGVKSVIQIIEILRARPFTLKTGKPCSKRTAQNCLKEFKAFLKWLDKDESYFWVWPVGYEFEPGRIAETPAGDSHTQPAKRLIETNTVTELTTLYFEADPIQRLYMLLGLNCGAISAEQTDLRLNEIYLNTQHPDSNALELPEERLGNWIVRFRGKTNVYGTWSLWPETVEAIQWWLTERDRIRDKICCGLLEREAEFDRTTEGRFLITQKGKPVATKTTRTGRLPNSWNSLLDRVVKQDKDFNRLSIKYLRKTGSSLVRKVSNGELASIYLAHGKPHGGDSDLEAYANRPFNQLFDALDKVHARLEPLWEAVPDPFAGPRRLGGKNHISKATIRKIKQMAIHGKSLVAIAEELSVHVTTVRRHIPDFVKN